MRNGYFEEGERIETVEGSRYDVDSGFVTRVHLDDTVEVYLYGEHDLVDVPVGSIRSQGCFVNDEHLRTCVEQAENARRTDPWRR